MIVAEPQAKRKGGLLPEGGVKAMAVGYIRCRLSVAAVQAPCISLLGRLEVMGPGLTVYQNDGYEGQFRIFQ